MRIVLIGNYPPDRQQSMERFALMLGNGLSEAGNEAEIWRPLVIAGSVARSTRSGLGKWLGYVDKWIIFPVVIRWRSHFCKTATFHVCDHSNAPYLAHLPRKRSSITCHDVLAIRGALGHKDAFCPSSRFGLILQKWILAHLSKSLKLASVSELTLKQLRDLVPSSQPDADWVVINNAFNESFEPMAAEERTPILEELGLGDNLSYILHVGSDLPRKNRKILLKMVDHLGSRWEGKVCFAGQPLDSGLREMAGLLGLEGRIVEVQGPDHRTLVALYSGCAAFVFPSYSEGFGWPLIEAQGCGVPVIASDVEPMPEVSGGAAVHLDPDDAEGFAKALLNMENDEVRADLIRRGQENCLRFTLDKMTLSYLKLMGGAC